MARTLVAGTPMVLLCAIHLTAATPDADIRRVLADQAAAWNAGDVRTYMKGYADSPSTTFVGSAIIKGHAQVLARYLSRYPTREAMGTLTLKRSRDPSGWSRICFSTGPLAADAREGGGRRCGRHLHATVSQNGARLEDHLRPHELSGATRAAPVPAPLISVPQADTLPDRPRLIHCDQAD